ncbi:hypothetical protein, partial [Agrobacterium vitis]|uniref:hypothetical protein n=1 Tax=Agrobacterium vitis TaxID=373 RepID=UPI0020353EC8
QPGKGARQFHGPSINEKSLSNNLAIPVAFEKGIYPLQISKIDNLNYGTFYIKPLSALKNPDLNW